MKFANATKFNRKSGEAEGSAVLRTTPGKCECFVFQRVLNREPDLMLAKLSSMKSTDSCNTLSVRSEAVKAGRQAGSNREGMMNSKASDTIQPACAKSTTSFVKCSYRCRPSPARAQPTEHRGRP
jgi:hypothetical protein